MLEVYEFIGRIQMRFPVSCVCVFMICESNEMCGIDWPLIVTKSA